MKLAGCFHHGLRVVGINGLVGGGFHHPSDRGEVVVRPPDGDDPRDRGGDPQRRDDDAEKPPLPECHLESATAAEQKHESQHQHGEEDRLDPVVLVRMLARPRAGARRDVKDVEVPGEECHDPDRSRHPSEPGPGAELRSWRTGPSSPWSRR